MVNAVEKSDGPKPRREPCIKTILILPKRERATLQHGVLSGLRACFLLSLGHEDDDRRHIARRALIGRRGIVSRDAMAPPELATDAPILHVLHPVAVGVLELRRVETDLVVHHRIECRLGQTVHFQEPLHGELRLDGHIGTLGEAHLVRVILCFLEQSGCIEVADDLLADGEAIHADVELARGSNGAIVVKDVDGGEVVFLAQHIVVYVVRRGDLEAACAELNVDVVVLDDGDLAPHERDNDAPSAEVLVLRVVRIDAHGRVAHDRFGAGRSHDGVSVFTDDTVAQVVKFALLLLINHLLVAEGGEGGGIPIDHADTTIDQSLTVQIAEDANDAPRADVVHSEGRAIPVAGSAKASELLEDDAAVLLFPLPSVAQKLLAGEIRLADSALSQSSHHLGLGGDGGVIRARHPAGIAARHACAAHKDVLNRVVEHVPHVEHAGDVGRRDDHRVRLALVREGAKETVVQPVLIPFSLDRRGIVFRC